MSEARVKHVPRDIAIKWAEASKIAEFLETGDETGGVYGVVVTLIKNHELVHKVEQMELDRDKIEILQPLFHWTPSSSTSHKFQKSSIKSKQYAECAIARAISNTVEKNLATSAAYMITAFAKDAHDLAEGHYTRSQIFVSFGREEACKMFLIDEGEASLQILNQNLRPSSPSSCKVMREDVEKFLCKLKTFFKSEFALNHFVRMDQKKKEHVEFTKRLFSLKSPNKKAPALEDFVEIRYNSSRGRHVVVTKDIPVGTTLLVEKPFLSGLVDIFKLEIQYCHHCTKHEFKPVPCPTCVFVLFCSEKCQEEAKNYHKYECPCFPDLHDLLSPCVGTDKAQWLIAFKLVCSLGPIELYREFLKEKEAKKTPSTADASDDNNLIRGCDPLTGIFDPSSFHTVRHVQRINQRFSFQNLVVALALTKVIETRTDFFQFQHNNLSAHQIDQEAKLQFKNYVAQVLYQQFDSTLFYAYNSDGSRQAAISPTVVLFSHSCDPNVIPCTSFHGDGLRIAKVAARDLKAGEELCISYTGLFYTMERNERRKNLLEQNGFKCDCIACSNFWPMMTEELKQVLNINPIFCCVNRSCPKSKDGEKVRLVLKGGGKNLKCPVCDSIYEEEKLMREFVKHLNTLERAKNLVEKDEPLKAVEDVLAASTYFQENFQSPSVHQIYSHVFLDSVLYKSCVDLVN